MLPLFSRHGFAARPEGVGHAAESVECCTCRPAHGGAGQLGQGRGRLLHLVRAGIREILILSGQ